MTKLIYKAMEIISFKLRGYETSLLRLTIIAGFVLSVVIMIGFDIFASPFHALSQWKLIMIMCVPLIVIILLFILVSVIENRFTQQTHKDFIEMIQGISHDMRQPLQAANIFAILLEKKLATPSDKALLDKLLASHELANQILDSINDLALLAVNHTDISLEPVSVNDLLYSLSEQAHDLPQAHNISLTVVDCNITVISNSVLLGRVMRNLLWNALSYTPRGRVLLGCRRNKKYIYIQVLDTGTGIEPSALNKIFTSYVRLNPFLHKGQGLGLSIVKRLIHRLNHKIEVTSTVGKGSCFSVRIKR